MKEEKLNLFWPGIGLTMLLFGACTNFDRFYVPIPEPDRIMVGAKQPPDIPVPKELTLQNKHNECFYFETSSFRSGKLVYKGPGTKESIVSFLKDQLPQFEWKITKEEDKGKNEYSIRAEKSYYSAIFTILQSGSTVTLDIEIETQTIKKGHGS